MENATLINAAEQYGSSLYIYDAHQMKENYQQFNHASQVDKPKAH